LGAIGGDIPYLKRFEKGTLPKSGMGAQPSVFPVRESHPLGWLFCLCGLYSDAICENLAAENSVDLGQRPAGIAKLLLILFWIGQALASADPRSTALSAKQIANVMKRG
jgi:hypothetical protein